MISLVNVCKSYEQREILKDINIEVQRGELLVIIGPSGSGKSSILRMIIGLMKPTSGDIFVDGQQVSAMKEDQLTSIRLKMSMVFQYSALFDSMTVGENVAFSLRQHTNLSETEIMQVVSERLEMVGLAGYESHMPSELSGGMKKRVSLARAVANSPDIVLYDEPTAGLDPIMSSVIDGTIRQARDHFGVTSIVVTHHMSSAFAIADRIAMIHDGKLIETGTVEQIQNSANPIVQQFINGWIAPHLRSPDMHSTRG